MGYLFLAIALFSGAAKGYCGKRTSGLITGLRDAAASNLIRTGLCILIGLIVVIAEGSLSALAPTKELIFLSAVSGISTAVFIVTWLLCVRGSAYMLMNVFLMLGVLVPLTLGIPVLGEAVSVTQWVGIGVLFVAVVILCSYNNSIKAKLTPGALLLLTVCGIANGVTDFSQKVFSHTMTDVPASAFNFYTYIFAFLTLGLCFLFIPKRPGSKNVFTGKLWAYITVMALCLFANSFFKTLAAAYLPSVLLFPLNQGASLILATGMSAVFFHEKITPKCILGITVAFIGLLIINVL